MAYRFRYRGSHGNNSSPGALMVIGGILMVLALILAGYYVIEHRDWVEVSYEAKDVSCTQVPSHKKGMTVERCYVIKTYTYNGVTYKQENSASVPTGGKGGTMMINPNNPKDTSDDKGNYIMSGIIGGIGLLVFLFGFIPAMRRRYG